MRDTATTTQRANARKGRLWRDLAYFLARPAATVRLLTGRSLVPDFRERIMLAVTQVNRCAFCSRYHTREALKAGVAQAEIAAILDAEFGGVPDDQQVAVLFAQHWADTQGAVDPEAAARLEERYDSVTRADILLSIHFINAMNALMSTFERRRSR
jgi:AhpD family alkylhydroperoxidase